MPQSPNKTTISGLVETLQKKVEPVKLYSALQKMNDDLNKTYDALFFGPLPAVDGNALTNLNSLNITGIIPEDNLPDNLAFQDRENIFDQTNFFVSEESAVIQIGFGTIDPEADPRAYSDEPTSWFRIGPSADSEFFISQNFDWDGSDFTLDDDLLSGSIITFINGDIQIKKWLPADAVDYPDPYLADTWFFNGKEFGVKNYAQDDDVLFATVNDSDVILLAESAGELTDDFRGHIAIPTKLDTDIPASGEARCNGIICLDKTNNRLIYYIGSARYRLSGVAF
jgi:hypothetical protein